MMDPWRIAATFVELEAIGFNPVALPLILFLQFGLPESWWAAFASANTAFSVTAFWMPAVAIVTYWLNGLLLLLVDAWVPHDVLRRFKTQPTKGFDKGQLAKVCRNLLLGQVLVIIPYGYCMALLGKYTPLGVTLPEELPSGRSQLFTLLFIVVFDEVTFFYSHWALHSKIFGVNLYTAIHKTHHEFVAPVGLVASYCHPIEMLVSNVLPLTAGGALIGSHSFTVLVWVMCAVLGTQFHHCGYRWPWLIPFELEHNPDFHDFHHQKFNSNYGLMGWLDFLHGTDKQWREELKKRGKRPMHPLSMATTGSVACALVVSIVGQFSTL